MKTAETTIRCVKFWVEDNETLWIEGPGDDTAAWVFTSDAAKEIQGFIAQYLGGPPRGVSSHARRVSDRLRDALALVEALEGNEL